MHKVFACFLVFGLMYGLGQKTAETNLESIQPAMNRETVLEADTTASENTYIYEAEPMVATTEGEEILTAEDIELITLVTMAEAEGECEYGKRLVIDTILNRMDSEYFPDTAYEVIFQPHQFSSMWNGRVDRCYVVEDICQLVREELRSRSNSDVIFFTAGHYSDYGVPMFQVDHHYFSSYD